MKNDTEKFPLILDEIENATQKRPLATDTGQPPTQTGTEMIQGMSESAGSAANELWNYPER